MKVVTHRPRKYPLTLTVAQRETLREQAGVAHSLWNFLHRYYTCTGAENNGVYPTLAQMDAQIRTWRKEFPWMRALPAQAAQAVLKTYRQAWKNFWGGTHDRPDFKSRKDRARRGIDVPQARDLNLTKLNAKWYRVNLPLAGKAKLRFHRDFPDTITGARLVEEAGDRWFLVVRGTVTRDIPEQAPVTFAGADRGVTHTLALSDGRFLDQQRTLTEGESKRLYRLERSAARKKTQHVKGTPFSNRLLADYAEIGKLRARQARRRDDFSHQTSRVIADSATFTVMEALDVKAMTASAKGTIECPGKNVAQKSGLNKSILDQGWGRIQTRTAYKSQENGGRQILVPAAYTSQTCHRCWFLDENNRESQAVFQCKNPTCGWSGNADYNASRVIRTLGILNYRHQEEERLAAQAAGLEWSCQDVEPIGVRRAMKRQDLRSLLAAENA